MDTELVSLASASAILDLTGITAARVSHFHRHHVHPHHHTFGLYPMWHLCLFAKILGTKFSQSPITRSIKCGIWALMGPSNPEDHWTHLGSNSILLTLTKIQEKNWFIQFFLTFSSSFSSLSPFWRLVSILSSRRDEFAKFPPIFPINHPPCIPISPSTQSDALWWIFEPKFSQFENFSI